MDLIIKISNKSKQLVLSLKKGGKAIDSEQIKLDSGLDSMLIASVDKILKRNRINPSILKRVDITGEVDKNSSSNKIVVTFVNALKTQILGR